MRCYLKTARKILSRLLTFCLVILAGEAVASGQAEQWSAPLGQAVNFRPSKQKVGRFERIEFLIEGVPAPETDVDICPGNLAAEIRLPSGGRVTVPAFWYQPYRRRTFSSMGNTVTGFIRRGRPTGWCVLPLGNWASIRCEFDGKQGQRRRGSRRRLEFECLPSLRRGFLRCSSKNPRFFETSDGQPFLRSGRTSLLSVVCSTSPWHVLKKPCRVWPRSELTTCEFGPAARTELSVSEGRKSAWTRSWHWKLPVEELPGIAGLPPGRKLVVLSGAAGTRLAVEPSWPVALLPDTEYLFTCKIRLAPGTEVILDFPSQESRVFRSPEKGQEWTQVQIRFRSAPGQFWLGVPVFRLATAGKAWLDELSLREAGPDGLGPELLWEADVNRPERGFYNPVDCAMLDSLLEAAEQAGIYLQLCMLTRDLYMWALKDPSSPEYDRAIADARRFFRHAIARWGYSTAVGAWEYWNEMDPGRPTERFYHELGQFFEQNDPYGHLRTTSTWHPSPADMNHPRLDIADLHFYLRPVGRPTL